MTIVRKVTKTLVAVSSSRDTNDGIDSGSFRRPTMGEGWATMMSRMKR
jgi:hypothetical protein